MQDSRPRAKAYARALVGVALATVILGGAWSLRSRTAAVYEHRLSRLVASSPYRNVGPGVGYVGDVVCGRCHAAIAQSYRGHPMGRSVVTGAGMEPKAAKLAFDAGAIATRSDAVTAA